MTNHLNENRSERSIIAAIAAALVFAVVGLSVGMIYAIKLRVEHKDQTQISGLLLVDSAYGLMNSSSALRLCTERETADEVAGFALVYAVRAETALEASGGFWRDSMAKEAFLNDASALLAGRDPMRAVEKAETLFRYSSEFYTCSVTGTEFKYDGELESAVGSNPSAAPDEEQIERAKAFVIKALDLTECEYIGGFGGRAEFSIELDGVSGYAEVDGDRIVEFAFSRMGGEPTDENAAKDIALTAAKVCGYDNLYVYSTEGDENGYTVKMCHKSGDAMCRDECASALVVGERAVAFTAGKCDAKHDPMKVRVPEEKARAAAAGADGEGVLVTLNDGTRDRICYEYRFTLEDGVHYVYICAENGKQMRVR